MKHIAETVWGVIGAGSVCEKKSLPALQKVPHSRVKTVMRRQAKACEAFAHRHGIDNWTTDSNDIFKDPQINAVYIPTPPDTHALYAIKAAQEGKAVYVEKPMARNQHECQTMIDACKAAGVPLFVAYYRRALPHFLRVKELLENGKLGHILSWKINFNRSPRPEDLNRLDNNWRVQTEISGGGYFHDLASHQLDLMDFLFGPVVDVDAQTENLAGLYEPADYINASFVFQQGIRGEGHWDFACSQPDTKDEIIITGDEGYVKFSTFDHARIEGVSERMGQISEEFILPDHIQMPLVKKIVAELRGEGECPSKGETAIRTTMLMDKICKK